MKVSEFDYRLPPELIAQYPAERRDQARLMVVDRQTGGFEHRRFEELPGILESRDHLVLNNSRVIPARLYGSQEGRQGRIEVLLLHRVDGDVWEVLLKPGRKAPPGTRLIFGPRQLEGTVQEGPGPVSRRLRFHYTGDFWDQVGRFGETPLPPYIRRPPAASDRERYQTVFASRRGSVAAPTAGLHFTSEILERTSRCEVTLHVGYGTFKPVSGETVEAHRMDAEYFEVSREAAEAMTDWKEKGERIITVGSTATRVVEHVWRQHGKVLPCQGWTDLFIYPGFPFSVAEGLLTNFHLPRSTLLLLVAAFAGEGLIRTCYEAAVREKYRFFSYGDAMLIL